MSSEGLWGWPLQTTQCDQPPPLSTEGCGRRAANGREQTRRWDALVWPLDVDRERPPRLQPSARLSEKNCLLMLLGSWENEEFGGGAMPGFLAVYAAIALWMLVQPSLLAAAVVCVLAALVVLCNQGPPTSKRQTTNCIQTSAASPCTHWGWLPSFPLRWLPSLLELNGPMPPNPSSTTNVRYFRILRTTVVLGTVQVKIFGPGWARVATSSRLLNSRSCLVLLLTF